MCWFSVAVTLLCAFTATLASPKDLQDFRRVIYDDVMSSAARFSEPGLRDYSRFLFDPASFQVIVGLRDYLLRLELEGLKKIEESQWIAGESTVSLCHDKGQSEEDCHNHVRVLHSHNNTLLACATHAFSPRCSWRQMQSLNDVIEEVNGQAMCPYNPHDNVTSVLTSGGVLFSALPLDFQSKDPAIVRSTVGGKVLRTKQYNSKWLSEPDFVGSFEVGDFIYFFFREAAVEYINCGKMVYSRVARVCKKDKGGILMLKNNWTTFIKARLNCSLAGDYPFYYDQIQSVYYVDHQEVFYATFTTPQNSIAGSAVCAFNLTAITKAFEGNFKYQGGSGSAWGPHMAPSHIEHLQCKTKTDKYSIGAGRYQLMDQAVQPSTLWPAYSEDLTRFSHLVVDVVATKHHEAVHVIYVAGSDRMLLKISVLPRTKKSCLVEDLEIFPKDQDQQINEMKYLKDTQSVYVGTDRQVLRIPAERCDKFKTRSRCLASMDPYCGWNTNVKKCTVAPNKNPLDLYWEQNVIQCPFLDQPVDGGWSLWSDWEECSRRVFISDPYSRYSITRTEKERCICRVRRCDSPAPYNNGLPCKGDRMEVSNCTVHGGWTEWSSWSACSATCGMAVKTRRRSCTNPVPRFGGRVCVGREIDETYCAHNPPCPVKSLLAVDGGWSSWEDWGPCSVRCGRGFRVRRRSCTDPAPRHDGRPCNGCDTDYGLCNKHPCDELKKTTGWTPWMKNNYTEEGSQEVRFRFTCKAPVPQTQLIRIGHMKTEQRFCDHIGDCFGSGNAAGLWSEWSLWSVCSQNCGSGTQSRERTCVGQTGSCSGAPVQTRVCNQQSCQGSWSCWSVWSGCTVSCGSGSRVRHRECLTPLGTPATNCVGHTAVTETCELVSCQDLAGWLSWSHWSACSSDRRQIRLRDCQVSSPGPGFCQGPSQENRTCLYTVGALAAGGDATSVGVLVASCIACFLLGAILAGIACYFLVRTKHRTAPSSRHRTIAKPNEYSLVPLKLSNGSVKLPPDDYTATIRRNQQKLSADYSSDNMFID